MGLKSIQNGLNPPCVERLILSPPLSCGRLSVHMQDNSDNRSIRAWVPRLTKGGPKYLALAEALRADVRSGRLKPGDRLPPQRLLARELGIDLTTVTRAFNEARRQGLIDASAGRGSFVRGSAPEASPGPEPRQLVDLSMNMPPQPPAARLGERIQQGLAELLGSATGSLQLRYQDTAGSGPDRAAGAAWLAPRLGPVPMERVLVVGGAQTALYGIAKTVLRPGEALCTPELTYPGLKTVAERLGLRLVPVATDGEGIDPAALDEACGREAPKAVYCVPTIHNPTTATMSPGRRERIVETARVYGLTIIEDDAYGVLPSRPPTPIGRLAPDITWHIATLAKCVSPALRTAYVVAPSLGDAMRLGAELRALALMAPPLMTGLATRWIADGSLDAITSAIRDESVARQELAAKALRGFAYRAHPEGHHLWLSLPQPWHQADVARHAGGSGLAVVPGAAFACDAAPEAIRISLGAAETREALRRGLDVLSALLSQTPGTVASYV
ncbi:MAG: PLP-dependent aminotransferase family protein [Enterovirga sp.]|nr:PLP-dependent aminotransferase family protein [Enterovirga sp.]